MVRPERIRTSDLLLRRQALSLAQCHNDFTRFPASLSRIKSSRHRFNALAPRGDTYRNLQSVHRQLFLLLVNRHWIAPRCQAAFRNSPAPYAQCGCKAGD